VVWSPPRHACAMPAVVIEDCFNVVGLHAKLAKYRGARSANIVEMVVSNACACVELRLPHSPILIATHPKQEVGGVATGTPARIARACAESGSSCRREFLVRAGESTIIFLAKSISLHCSAPISCLRWPVRSKRPAVLPKGPSWGARPSLRHSCGG